MGQNDLTKNTQSFKDNSSHFENSSPDNVEVRRVRCLTHRRYGWSENSKKLKAA